MTITFILPHLFENQCRQFLDSPNLEILEQLTTVLAKAKKAPSLTTNEWLIEQFNLPKKFSNSAQLMAQAEGISSHRDSDDCHWLRADPVMLSATHNGIVCRGNRVLNLTKDERDSIELLVNDYYKEQYKEQSIELIFSGSSQGYLKYHEHPDCEFKPLNDVVGQDISRALPKGNKSAFWHSIFTDIQMLLNNCDVNLQRQSSGLPTINGLWLWGESIFKHTSLPHDKTNTAIYSDDRALSGALDQPIKLQQLAPKFDSSRFTSEDTVIHVSEFYDGYLQNDQEGWNDLFQQWVNNWLIPALKAVENKALNQVVLMTDDGFSYQYNHFSKWCFWRNHQFENTTNNNLF